ncbi:MAG: BtpA/SgcQ family protein [Limnochordaceae bacterium]|nr:BtpA/SgcQ family protein [Limnochordaceae bacterium]
MAHFPPLPGTPQYDAEEGMRGIRQRVEADVKALVDGGVDAIMFCNEGDRPYTLKASLEGVAAMSSVIGQLLPLPVPFGVDYLWDPKAALAIAVANGGAFVREVLTGAYDSDMGLWVPDAPDVLRYRRYISGDGVMLMFNITPEYASPLGTRTAEQVALSVATSSIPDVLLVSGPRAGAEVEVTIVKRVKEAVGERIPVMVNTGVRAENVAAILEVADGVIVGTSLKVDGYTWNRVDPRRVSEFMKAVRTVRGR